MERKNNISAEELKKQQEYIAKIRSINEKFEETEGRKKTMCIQTFGCQMNAHDSEKILGMLEEMGYVEAEDEKSADFIIYNTCCVREIAENKVYGNLGFLKHQKELNPHMKIALCGCMMQQSTVIETIRQKYKYVDIVFGTFNLYKLPELMYRNIETNSTIFDIWDKHGEIIEDLPSIRKYKFKASVNIMFGCNNFCSYCIVPYVRGRERSRTSEDIVREIKSLVADGVKEITLLGQNVNSYGKNLEEDITFAQLLRKVNEIEGLERIRFMTSHPKDLSDELIIAMKECDKVCNHIHLPFQAGNNEILKSMNRRYTKEKYLELVGKIKKEIPDILLSTDIIVGFPGETEEDFEDTLDVVRKVKFEQVYMFIYSRRTGTPGDKMENQVPDDVKHKRFDRLKALVENQIEKRNKEYVGTIQKILVEGRSKTNENTYTGRTDSNKVVIFEGKEENIGKVVDVEITSEHMWYLKGAIVNG